MESTVLKTVAGFLNADGETLLIGVTDDGKAVALEYDYATLQKKDWGGFSIWLSDLLFERYGREMAPFLDFHRHTLDSKDVCRVVVRKSRMR